MRLIAIRATLSDHPDLLIGTANQLQGLERGFLGASVLFVAAAELSQAGIRVSL